MGDKISHNGRCCADGEIESGPGRLFGYVDCLAGQRARGFKSFGSNPSHRLRADLLKILDRGAANHTKCAGNQHTI